jgi:uncharacterized protein YidB (DUF937 family)
MHAGHLAPSPAIGYTPLHWVKLGSNQLQDKRYGMGLFDSVVSQVSTALSGDQGGVMEAVMHLINDPETGGLQGLVKTFQEKGLGDEVASWIGNGQNITVSAEQIQQVIGSERLQSIAGRFGLSPETLSAGLAEMLPHVIDRLSPSGQLPESHLVEQGLALLKGKLFG